MLRKCNLMHLSDLGKDGSQGAIGKMTFMLLAVTFGFMILVNPIATAHILASHFDLPLFETTDPSMIMFRNVAQVRIKSNIDHAFYG